MASITSDLIRTLHIRYLNEDGEMVTRGPFHHTHIRDLIDFGHVNPDITEVSSEKNPEWVQLEEHAIYSLVVVTNQKFSMQSAPETVSALSLSENDPKKDALHAKNLLWNAMSDEDKANWERTQEMQAYHARTSTKARYEIKTIIGFFFTIYMVYSWFFFSFGIFAMLDCYGLYMFLVLAIGSWPEGLVHILMPSMHVAKALAPAYEDLTFSTTLFPYFVSVAGFMLIVSVHMRLNATEKRWWVTFFLFFFWSPIPVIFIYKAMEGALIGLFLFSGALCLASYAAIYLSYKCCRPL